MVTLSEYVGFIFKEITLARVMADSESKRIAEAYAKDEVLKEFSVPRFKIPEMDLHIPMLISGAKFSSTIEFTTKGREFRNVVVTEINNRFNELQLRKNRINENVVNVKDIGVKFTDIRLIDRTRFISPLIRPQKPGTLKATKGQQQAAMNLDATLKEDLAGVEDDILALYAALKENIDPMRPQQIIATHYAGIFNKRLVEAKLDEEYKKHYPQNELYLASLKWLTEFVLSKTFVINSKIENILVSPETNVIRNGADALSIFTINAKITEEGLFIKTAQDETGKETKIVDFE